MLHLRKEFGEQLFLFLCTFELIIAFSFLEFSLKSNKAA